MTSGGITIAGFLLIAAIEILWPWRPTTRLTAVRWLGNSVLWVLTAVLGFLWAPLDQLISVQFEIPPLFVLPSWTEIAIAVPALDLLAYGLHRAFHALHPLWRLHALHHSDPEFDVTTTLRHHPGEWLIMAVVITAAGAGAGLSPSAIAIYASINLSVQLFNHANFTVPPLLAKALELVIVTPNLHRIHHSRRIDDASSNYGMIFSVWDRLFGTYREEPELGTNRLEFGLDEFRDKAAQRPDRMLWQPLLVRRT
jgi:sterol desaturase/sphingolipid hydroxylase (fatty acid hydroxylase superfamily)